MSKTYQATLHDSLLRWIGESPDAAETLDVRVTVVEAPPALSRAERGQRMADALERLAQLGAFSEIKDPSAWQREIRKDRPFPGRDDEAAES